LNKKKYKACKISNSVHNRSKKEGGPKKTHGARVEAATIFGQACGAGASTTGAHELRRRRRRIWWWSIILGIQRWRDTTLRQQRRSAVLRSQRRSIILGRQRSRRRNPSNDVVGVYGVPPLHEATATTISMPLHRTKQLLLNLMMRKEKKRKEEIHLVFTYARAADEENAGVEDHRLHAAQPRAAPTLHLYLHIPSSHPAISC
jgi:hypothetical protein